MKTKLAVLLALVASSAGVALGDVHDVFARPPKAARLQVWYHWIADCVTEAGLVADFKAMGELGIGTAHIFAPSMGDLPVKAKPMDAEWLRLFAVAIREAKRNGLTLGFHNCPGWSSSGGPWIAPENAMKKVVWRETDLELSAAPARVQLPQPPANCGFYRDIAVFAFPCVRRRDAPGRRRARAAARARDRRARRLGHARFRVRRRLASALLPVPHRTRPGLGRGARGG